MSRKIRWVVGIVGGLIVVCLVAAIAAAVWGWTRSIPVQEVEVPAAQATEVPQGAQPTAAPVEEAPAEESTVEVEEALPSQGDEEPQIQQAHPSLYVETGTSGTRQWTLTASDDEVVIVGGWAVNGTDGGVYRAIAGPTEVEVTVTDGFAAVIVAEWAQNEFCFRVSQAEQFGWAHGTVEPLAEWSSCQ